MNRTTVQIPRWLGPSVVMIIALLMLNWSWGTWPDCVIDFGRELYVPWRLSQGELLYRDIASYFNGPLSPYTHALLFKIFGASLRTLVIFNLVVIAALATMLYRLLSRTFGVLAAAAALIAFFVLFAFAQFTLTGNYNFLCPYSYELSHGITLSIGAILCLENAGRSPRRAWFIATGLLTGLVFLTKAEIFLAALVAVVTGLILQRCRVKDVVLVLIAACAPVAIAMLCLCAGGLSAAQSVRGILGAWKWLGDDHLLGMPYFKELAGTANIGGSLKIIVVWTLAYLVIFGGAFALGRAIMKQSKVAAISIFLALVAIGIWSWQRVIWGDFIRPVPIVLVIALIAQARRPEKDRNAIVLVVWALAMLAKMPLNAHIEHYGFALAMPATLVTIALLLHWRREAIFRAVVLAALVVAIYPRLRAMELFWSQKTVLVGEGGDTFRADARADVINVAVDQINALASPGATLAVVPEGLIVNFLTRRINPTGQLNFTPPAMVMYGEAQMLAAFRAHPPDLILFTGVDTKEYGPRFFGGDYARELGKWMQENYRVISTIGKGPFRDNQFGGVLLQKR